jgi:hypothetical protein
MTAPSATAAAPVTYPNVNGLYGCSDPKGPSTNPKVIAFPYIDAILLRVLWDFLEPTEGNYVGFGYLDTTIASIISAGKFVCLLVKPGDKTPAWVYAAGAKSVPGTSGNPIPAPYDKVYLDKFTTMVAALGARYGTNAAIRRVTLTGINNTTGEMGLTTSIADWTAVAYTSQKILGPKGFGAWYQIATAWSKAFPNSRLSLPIIAGQHFPDIGPTGQPQQGAGAQIQKDIIDWCVAKLGANRFTLQNNALDTQWIAKQVLQYVGQCTIGYQQIWPAIGWAHSPKWQLNHKISYCGSDTCTPTDTEVAEVLQNALNNGINNGKAHYLEIYPDDLVRGSAANANLPIPAIVNAGGIYAQTQATLAALA